MQQSADSIKDIILNQNKDDPVIVMAHNGPRGLGAERHNPCGKDFRPEEYGPISMHQLCEILVKTMPAEQDVAEYVITL